MCGIFAVVGGADAPERVVAGLKRLDYRGYDSWGVAVVDQGHIQLEKHIGKISEVAGVSLPTGHIAIGHTRWATHGGVTQNNAHPHFSTDERFVLAQNGVVENFTALKQELEESGYTFSTQTDTEVIVRLIEEELKETVKLREAILRAFRQLGGRNTIILLAQDGRVYAARNGSPLLLGHNPVTNTYFLSSDVLSLASEVAAYTVIENGELVELVDSQYKVFATDNGEVIDRPLEPLTLQHTEATKGEFPHFMLKEIYDTPSVIDQVIEQPSHLIDQLADMLREAHQAGRHIYCIGSGTAGVAAAQTAYYFRMFAGIPAVGLVGADALEYLSMLQVGDVMVAPSQSGETADVLEVLEAARSKGVKIVTYVNMPASSMTRLADLSFLANAGPEICVMSTKVFTSQAAWGYLVAKAVAGQYEDALGQLGKLSEQTSAYLREDSHLGKLKELAAWLSTKKDIFLLAKGANFQIIREGMVKLIEGSYIHAHALPAGDLKHYAITLIEDGTPVIVVSSDDVTRADVLTAAHEVQARGAAVVHIGSGQVGESFARSVITPDLSELSAIMNVIPLQLLAYELAVLLGHDVDHPRNIAKSVTVK